MSDEQYNHQIGTILSPSDLRAIPGYEESVDFSKDSGRRLLEMLDYYDFSKADEYPCGIHGCRTVHQHGYLVRSTDGKLTNIGRDCGKRHLQLDFIRSRKSFRIRRKAADNLKSIMAIREGLSAYQVRLDALMSVSGALAECRDILREWMPSQHAALMEMGRRGSGQIVRTRRMSKREAEIHYLQTRTSRKDYEGGRPTIEEAAGVMDGCLFFRESLGLLLKKQLLPPIDQLKAMGDQDIQDMTPKHLEDLSRNVNNALRLIEKAEGIAGLGLRFFAPENIRKLNLLDATSDQIDRIMPSLEELAAFRAQ